MFKVEKKTIIKSFGPTKELTENIYEGHNHEFGYELISAFRSYHSGINHSITNTENGFEAREANNPLKIFVYSAMEL